MDMYKLITLIVLLNISLAMADKYDDKEKGWMEALETSEAYSGLTVNYDGQKGTLEKDEVYTQKDDSTQQEATGISVVKLGSMFFDFIFDVVLGGIIFSIGTVNDAITTGSGIILMVGMFSTLFMLVLYSMLILKIYTWGFNKDVN